MKNVKVKIMFWDVNGYREYIPMQYLNKMFNELVKKCVLNGNFKDYYANLYNEFSEDIDIFIVNMETLLNDNNCNLCDETILFFRKVD